MDVAHLIEIYVNPDGCCNSSIEISRSGKVPPGAERPPHRAGVRVSPDAVAIYRDGQLALRRHICASRAYGFLWEGVPVLNGPWVLVQLPKCINHLCCL
jgi:hypothetical protein